MTALLCACAFSLAACNNYNQDSGFGIAWVSLTDNAGDFTSYIVTVDSVVLTGKTYGEIGVIETPEVIDFTKLKNISELWSAANISTDTYTEASIILDYTTAQITVMENGVPTSLAPVDPSGAALTTITVNVNLDPNNPLVLIPTYATTDAHRLALDFDLQASNTVNLATGKVTVAPFFTVATSPFDDRLIRIRGPLINSSLKVGTYSVAVRPFFDEVNSLGTVSLFNSANTIYTLDGTPYVGAPGLAALSQTSAGSTMTEAWTTFTASATPIAGAGVIAGSFYNNYVVAGSTLEDFYTYGLEGDVIARSGNVLTLRGATLTANAAQVVQFETADSVVIVGPPTIVTADGIVPATPFNYNSIAVGQHIAARGIYTLSPTGVPTLDATGASATNTGSVRLLSTEAFGTLVSSASGGLILNLQALDDYPASVFNFAGNGSSAAQDPTPANYLVGTPAPLMLPALAAGDPLWVDGYSSPFGAAPPDFIAAAVNAEPTVPAVLSVVWSGAGTTAPFAALSDSGLSIDLGNAAFASGTIRIGAESIDVTTLAATPQIIPQQAVPSPTPGLPALTLPVFAIGFGAVSETVTNPIAVFNTFSNFVTQAQSTFAAATPATKLTARGFYNRATNIFSASTIDVVL